jgi:choline-sulfatase
MKSAGYDTYMTGKWHIEANATKSFDVVRHVRPGMPGTVESSYNRPIDGQKDTWSSSNRDLGGFWEGGKHWSEVAADDAIDYIQMAASKPNPFFMYVAFNAPHDPRQAPQEFLDKYPLDRIKLPRNYLAEYPFKDTIGCGPDLRDEKLGPFPRTEHAVKVHRREYYALISHLDEQIGRILQALEKSGQADNTWIFFTADHGLAVGHHGLFGKQNMYDHSLRVPFIVAGPSLPTNIRKSTPIYLQDAMATALELANVPKPETCEFQSVASLARGEQQPAARSAIYGGYLQLQRSVTKDGWKLIVYPKAATTRLYHLTNDPDELVDLASDPAHTSHKEELFAELVRLQASLDDRLDLQASFPQLRR